MYEQPEMKIISLETEDVIMASRDPQIEDYVPGGDIDIGF